MYEPNGFELKRLSRAIREYRHCPSEAHFEEIENAAAMLLRDNKSVAGWFVWLAIENSNPESYLQAITLADQPEPTDEVRLTVRPGDVLKLSRGRQQLIVHDATGKPLLALSSPQPSQLPAKEIPPRTFTAPTALQIKLDLTGRFVVHESPLEESPR